MFTWICPKCGSEVPPSYKECPTCTGRASQAAPPIAPIQPPPPAAVQPPSAPPPEKAPAVRPKTERTVSPLLIVALSGVTVVALLGALYFWVLPSNPVTPKAPATLERGGTAAVRQGSHPLAKHLEIAGMRLVGEDKGTARIQFVVVNHSGANLPDLDLNIILRGSTPEAVFEFPQKLPSLGPYESKEFTTTVKTKLKPYELPDWQYLKAEFTVSGV